MKTTPQEHAISINLPLDKTSNQTHMNKRKTFLALLGILSLTLAVYAGIKVGQPFPELGTYKLEGTLPSDTKDKVVLVDFWASWCGPCGESFPAMEALNKKYASKGLVIIAVNVDENKSDMDEFLKKHEVTFTVVRDSKQKLVEKAGINSMPGSFLLGKDGKVAFAHTGFHGDKTVKEYEQEIESLLSK